MTSKSPYEKSYTLSHSSEGYGERYKATFEKGYYGIEWELFEEPLLQKILLSIDESESLDALDFACGTGRISRVVSEHLNDVTGVDVSSSMLEVAKVNARHNVKFLCKNILDEPMHKKYGLVTAFRFFLNAEPELKESAMKAISNLTSPGSYFISNIHINSNSPVGIIYRVRNKISGITRNRTMSHKDFVKLAGKYGFKAERTYWYGYTPRPGNFIFPGFRGVMKVCESVGQTLNIAGPIAAQSFIVVFRKTDE